MSLTKNVFVHVGMPKAASTFLQSGVFPYVPRFSYLSKMKSSLYRITDGRSAECIDDIRSKTLSDIEGCECDNVLISAEEFFGDPWRGFSNSADIAQKMADILPRAKILVLIRKQSDFLESFYKYSHLQGRIVFQKRFLNLRKDGSFGPESNPARPRGIDVRQFKWLPLVKSWMEAFGSENVLCLPVEMMKVDRGEFLGKLSDFLRVDRGDIKINEASLKSNRGLSQLGFWVSSLTNVFPSVLDTARVHKTRQKLYDVVMERRQQGRIIEAEFWLAIRVLLGLNRRFIIERVVDRVLTTKQKKISSDIRRRIQDEFIEDNVELSSLIGIDLRKLDY